MKKQYLLFAVIGLAAFVGSIVAMVKNGTNKEVEDHMAKMRAAKAKKKKQEEKELLDLLEKEQEEIENNLSND